MAACEHRAALVDDATPSPRAAPEAESHRRHASVLRRNLSLCTGEGLVGMPIVYLSLPGNFIVAISAK